MSAAFSSPKRFAGLMAVLALVRMVLALLESILEGMEERDPERPVLARLVAHMARQEARLLADLAAADDGDVGEAVVRRVRPRGWIVRGTGDVARRGWAGAVPEVARAPPWPRDRFARGRGPASAGAFARLPSCQARLGRAKHLIKQV